MKQKQQFIVSPIAGTGLAFSILIGWLVDQKKWSGAAIMFCYGITLLGARIAQLIAKSRD